MNWIIRYGQGAGWAAFLIAFLIVALVPERTWVALPLYLIAGILFLAVILERRRQTNDR